MDFLHSTSCRVSPQDNTHEPAFIIFKLEHLNANFIACRHVRYFERAPTCAKYVYTHLAYWCFWLFGNHGRLPYLVPAHDLAIKRYDLRHIGDGNSYA